MKELNQSNYKATIIKDLGITKLESGQRRRYAIFECIDCKTHFKANVYQMKNNSGRCISCANSKRNKIYKNRNKKMFAIWYSEKERCNNPKHKLYCNYGAKGITFSDEFLDFDIWYEYVMSLQNANGKGLTIDRKNNELGYEKNNLRWVDMYVQAVNKGMNKNNNTGYKGVYKRGNKFAVKIMRKGKIIILKSGFSTAEEAYAAGQKALEQA